MARATATVELGESGDSDIPWQLAAAVGRGPGTAKGYEGENMYRRLAVLAVVMLAFGGIIALPADAATGSA
jgi:hypothetical protein